MVSWVNIVVWATQQRIGDFFLGTHIPNISPKTIQLKEEQTLWLFNQFCSFCSKRSPKSTQMFWKKNNNIFILIFVWHLDAYVPPVIRCKCNSPMAPDEENFNHMLCYSPPFTARLLILENIMLTFTFSFTKKEYAQRTLKLQKATL